MNTGDHLEELRRRVAIALLGLVPGILCGLIFCPKILALIRRPYENIMESMELTPFLQTLAPTDGFATYLKIALLLGTIISSPWLFYQLWKFVATGLYSHEKRYVYLAIPTSSILFILGALFFFFVIAGPSLRFFIVFNQWFLGIGSTFTFQNYISYMITLTIVFGLGFQTPIAIFFLVQLNIVSLQALSRARKYIFLGSFVLAMFVTPPDVLSQIALAVPLYLLYELGILMSRLSNRHKKTRIGIESTVSQSPNN